MSEIIVVYQITDEDDGITVVVDNLEEMLDYVRDVTSLGMGSLGAEVCLKIVQAEMERSQFDQLADPLDL